MKLNDEVAIVTGGAEGLGAAICRLLAAEGAAGVVVADINEEGARTVADQIDGIAVRADVGVEGDVRRLVHQGEERFGRIDVVFANAGLFRPAHPFSPDAPFEELWRVHIMSLIYLARHTLPQMLARGQGGFVITASTDGITTSTSNLAYAITKHGQVAAAEWLSMVYGSRGINVSCFCPGWMWTAMTRPYKDRPDAPLALEMAMSRAVSAEEAAQMLINGVTEGKFLIPTADDTLRDLRHKARDYDGWIAQLRDWHDMIEPEVGPSGPA